MLYVVRKICRQASQTSVEAKAQFILRHPVFYKKSNPMAIGMSIPHSLNFADGYFIVFRVMT